MDIIINSNKIYFRSTFGVKVLITLISIIIMSIVM